MDGNMTSNALRALVTPPKHPVAAGAGKVWPKIKPGLSFPADYMEFIDSYGTGKIANFVVLFNPFSPERSVNFFEQFSLILTDLEELNWADPDCFDYPLFVTAEGLISIGVTDNGDYLFWVARSDRDSDHWGVAVVAARSPEIEYFQLNLTTMLAGVLSGALKSRSFPSTLAHGMVSFDPIDKMCL